MNIKIIKNTLLTFVFSLSHFIHAELTEEQEELIKDLLPDQQKQMRSKMESSNKLEKDIEDVLANKNSYLIEKPELEYQDDRDACNDCIYGYDFFRYSPTTFAPGNKVVISKMRGKWIEKKFGNCNTSVIVTFHPAFLMRQPAQKKMAWIDLKMIRDKKTKLKI